MLLTRLQVQNFGPLLGYFVLDISPVERTRPIVLFGGRNGAGKTTILEAIRLCLYGRRALGSRPTLTQYHEYLRKKLHHGARATRRASVGLEFEHGHAGEQSVYRIERAWERRGARIVEDLLVIRDGHPLESLDRTHWQDFVDALIPPALAELFFFDGERIQSLAEDDANDGELAAAIRSLLGLDVVEQLQADLDIYLSRQSGVSQEAIQTKIDGLRQARHEYEHQQDRLAQEAGGLKSQLLHQQAQIRRIEDRIAGTGGRFAQDRTALEAERRQLEASRQEAQAEIRELCGELLPFALAPRLVRRVVSALMHEVDAEHATILVEDRRRLAARLSDALDDPTHWRIDATSHASDELRSTLLPRFQALIDAVLLGDRVATAATTVPVVHGLATVDATRITALLQRALADTGPQIRRLSARIHELDERRRRVEHHLQRAPDDEEVRPLFDELTRLHGQLAALEQNLAKIDEERKRVDLLDQQAQRELERAEDELRRSDRLSRRLELALGAKAALRDFHDRLGRARLAELEQTIVACFNRLARKEELLSRISIDPGNFKITLFTRDDRPLPKDALSAGEKQIYAIALLWALGQVSGRKLPVIVDTPLGRLDTIHRRNLITAYFPYAAEQVLVLSTDSEIDQALMRQLEPAVSRSYRLEYDPAEQASTIVAGYFWDTETASAAGIDLDDPSEEMADDDALDDADGLADDRAGAAVEPTAARA